tara:strand:- start:697 stop:906 length:210 start_codon:yes stop_codon:yes gene_type:complete
MNFSCSKARFHVGLKARTPSHSGIFFKGLKKWIYFFSLLGGGIVLFCARDPRFDWRRAVRRVMTLSFPV